MAFLLFQSLLNRPKQVNYKRDNAYARFNFIFLITVFGFLTTIALINKLVDPYGIEKTPSVVGWNLLKPTQDNQTRLFKSAEVIQFKPKRLILGSSTVILGINPKYPSLNQDAVFYNLGLTGVYISDVRHYFEHALLNQPKIDRVILGLDFFMFNAVQQKQNFDRQSFVGKTQISLQKKLELNLSFDTLNKSLYTIRKNRSDPQTIPYYNLGMRNNVNLEQLGAKTDPFLPFKKQIQTYLTTYYKNYQISQDSLQDLKAIVEICRKNNINLTVFISPLHASQMEAIEQEGLWNLFEQWKLEVSQITPVWDFSDYNSIATEAITKKMKYFHDSVHYSQETGDLIISRMLSNKTTDFPANFGVILLPGENQERYLQSIRIRRDRWREENSKIVTMVEKLIPSP